jgi:hypothetical protein
MDNKPRKITPSTDPTVPISLGWIWDSTTMTVQLPPDRCLRILKELRTAKKRIYKKKTTSVRTLVILIGMLSTIRIQFPKASLYLKRLSTILHTHVNKEGWDIWTPWPDGAVR